eukprot:COSAG01_NODE_146_length_24099_cov_25.341208_33_plen_82_part_00
MSISSSPDSGTPDDFVRISHANTANTFPQVQGRVVVLLAGRVCDKGNRCCPSLPHNLDPVFLTRDPGARLPPMCASGPPRR